MAVTFHCTIFLLTKASIDRIVVALVNDGFGVEPGGKGGVNVFVSDVSAACVLDVTPIRDAANYATAQAFASYLGDRFRALDVPHFGGTIRADSTIILHGFMPKAKGKPKKPKNPLDNVYPIRDKNDQGSAT
jgi:hypothetical protein